MNLAADSAIGLGRSPRFARGGLIGFLAYFAGVVGGSAIQPALLPAAHMGWLQQVGGTAVVAAIALFLRDRRDLLGLNAPLRGWLVPAVACGLSIMLVGALASAILGDKPESKSLEYFLYEATMPGLGEELGFRGLLFGALLAALVPSAAARGRIALCVIASALPFALLHLLESSGLKLLVLALYTFYAGIVLALVRLRTGSLWPAVLAHNIANVSGGVLTVLLYRFG
jgi:membrane protease YdiL (CAAX protease family)